MRSLRGAKLANGTYANLLSPAPQLAQMNGASGTLTVSDHRAPLKRVTIAWREGGAARARSLSLTTLITAGGVTP